MAVMAIAVPMILGLVVAGGESSRQAERETRAVLTARTVFEEIRRTLDGNSEFIEVADLPWRINAADTSGAGVGGGGAVSGAATTPETGEDWLIFELNRDGEILAQADEMEYEEGWRGSDPAVTALAAVRGYFQEVEDAELVDGEPLQVFRIELRVESPARALARDRERVVFFKSDSLR